ncbi:MAG: carbohydrate ABC transporter permease [Actinobacteria bacterium]|nr:carbohydrate ABC transporter permease [Actinomycetota bacterium]
MFKLTIGQKIFTRVIVAVALVIVIVPLLWVFFLAFKRPDEVYQSTLFIFPKNFHFTLENFPGAIEFAQKALKISYPRMYLNSIIVTAGGLIIGTFAASFAAFAMVHYKFRTKELYYTFILLSYMIPVQVLLIPLYLVLLRLNLLNSYFALIFPYATMGIPIATLILRNFFSQVPFEFTEAALIDGASSFQIYRNIYLPIARPAIATCIIFLFLEMWNEFLFAFIFIRVDALQTLPLAMSRIGIGAKFPIPWAIYGASIVLAVGPIFIIFMVFQRWFVRGIIAGGIKG